jgi:dipeptidase E
MPLILTSSFSTVAKELIAKGVLPANASVAFIPTAGDVYPETPWIVADRLALVSLGYRVVDVDLKGKTAERLKEELTFADIIFVAGGNTTYLVEEAHRSGFSSIIGGLLAEGKMYIGSSAGSILAGPNVLPFVEEDLGELGKDFVIENTDCLNLVDYIVLPHYPGYAPQNDAIAEKYAGQFEFVKLCDDEYRGETM